ncbi:MAG: YIP1 family protein [Neomegalonema sp.]|nr:YIP1 family protein [Neomegalonema sp.]
MSPLLLSEMLQAYLRPRASAAWILAQRPSFGAVIVMVMAAVVISALISVASTMIAPPLNDAGERVEVLPASNRLVLLALIDFGQLIFISFIANAFGKAFGGKGEWIDLVRVCGWHALVSVLATFASAVVGVVAPGLSALVIVAALLYLLYMLAAFIAEAHGFASTPSVLLVGMVVLIGISFAIALIATMLGYTPPGLPS